MRRAFAYAVDVSVCDVDGLLDGVDAIDWARLKHAYGKADRVPHWLAESLDPDIGLAALDRLDSAVYHQGGAVYSAGAAVVPFLIRMAADPSVPHRSQVLALVARFARLANEMRKPWRTRPDALTCRAAVYDATDVFRALLDEPDPVLRTAAVEVLVELVDRAGPISDDLMRRFPAEPDYSVREQYVLALADKDFRAGLPAEQRSVVVDWLIAQTPVRPDPLRLSFLIARRRFDPAAVAYRELLAAYGDQPEASIRWLGTEIGDDRPGRMALARYAVARAVRTGSASDLAEVGAVMMKWRSATGDLVPVVARVLDGPSEPRQAALHLLAASGEAARPWSDALAANIGESGRTEALAVWALARLADPRALPSVQRSLAEDPGLYAFGGSHYSDQFYWLTQDPGVADVLLPLAPFAASLLPAIRLRLRPGAPSPVLFNLCEALIAYGAPAVEALPELEQILGTERHALACTVIGGLGTAASAVGDRLRTFDDGAAAWALFMVAGAPEPFLTWADAHPDELLRSTVARQVADLGPLAVRQAAPIEQTLVRKPQYWPTWDGVELAYAHSRLTGDSALCLDVLDAALDPLRHGRQLPVSRLALRYLARLGPEAGRFGDLLTEVVHQDERFVYNGGWRGIAEDDELRALAAAALAAAAGDSA